MQSGGIAYLGRKPVPGMELEETVFVSIDNYMTTKSGEPARVESK